MKLSQANVKARCAGQHCWRSYRCATYLVVTGWLDQWNPNRCKSFKQATIQQINRAKQ